MDIPKIIHLTAKKRSDVNDIQIAYLKKLHPDFEINFYDDDLCKKYLTKNYNQQYVDCFNNIKNGAHKADFFRYCILFKQGGYYIDTDNWPTVRLDTLIDNCDLVSTLCKMVSSFPNNDKYHKNHIHNGFIECKPNLIIIKNLIDYIYQNSNPEIAHKILEPDLKSIKPLYYYCYVRHFYILLHNMTFKKPNELLPNKIYKIDKFKLRLLNYSDRCIYYCCRKPPSIVVDFLSLSKNTDNKHNMINIFTNIRKKIMR